MTSQPETLPPTRRRIWLWIVLALLALAAVVVVLFETEDTVDVDQADQAAPPPLVSVTEVVAKDAQAEVSVFAELRPRWDAELRSAVTGRIEMVHPGALAGAQVAKGDPLFSIEKTQYEAGVAVAEMELEQAHFEVLRAKNNVTVAQKQFERDGAEPPTELAIQIPQLRIAEKSLAAAQSRLKSARHALEETEVVAPFAGFVTNRFASLGQTVNVGEPLVHLSDNRQFELVAELSQSEWALLRHPIDGQSATLSGRDGTRLGTAQIRRGGGFLDRETRQARVFLDRVETTQGVLAGDFLRVTFQGRAVPRTLTIPEGALTRGGYVWLVDDDNLLVRITPDILFRTGDAVVISAPETEGQWRVAVTPLASFLPGQKVTPKAAEE